MIEFYTKGSDESSVIKSVANKLLISEDLIEVSLENEENYLVKVKATITAVCKKYLDSILENLDFDYKTEIISSGDGTLLLFNVYTDENAILIGKNGKNLQALNLLLQNFIRPYNKDKVIIKIDCGDYLNNRIKRLEILATKVAKDVLRSKGSIKLEPMNSYERRIVHSKLTEWKNIETTSEGVEPNRCLVIKYCN